MKNSKILIDTFRNTASYIKENPEKFDWYDCDWCTVAIFIRQLFNIPDSCEKLECNFGVWRTEFKNYKLGKNNNVYINQLINNYDFNYEDICFLEYASTLENDQISNNDFKDPEYVFSKLNKKADKMELLND